MTAKIEAVLKHWSSYEMCKQAGVHPMINVHDFERVIPVKDQAQAEKIMDKLGIVFCD